MAKAHLQYLALFGGPAAFVETLHVGRPNIGDRGRLLARINDMLDRRWLTNHGPFVAELERPAALLGVRHCIAMCNGTVALEIACSALDLRGRSLSRPLPLWPPPMPCNGRRSRRSSATCISRPTTWIPTGLKR